MIAAVFATFFVGFSGCKQLTAKQDVKPKSATASKIPTYDEIPAVRTRTIRLANGRQDQAYLPFLEVKTKAQLDSLLKANESWSTEQQTAFEQQYGYSSMLSTFNEGLNVQKMYLSAAAAAGGDALRSKPFAEFITNHPHTFRIEGGKELQLNTFHPSMARVLNANGIIRVAGHIFQYTRQYIKIIEGGDERQIPKLLTATQDDRAAKIRVFPLTNANNARTGEFRITCTQCIDKGGDVNDLIWAVDAKMFGTVIGQQYSYPIWGPQQLVCIEPSIDNPTPDGELWCYYAQYIVGYQTNSVLAYDFYTSRTLSFLNIYNWQERVNQNRTKRVIGSWSVNGQPMGIYFFSAIIDATVSATVYDGPHGDLSGFFEFEDNYTGSIRNGSCPGNDVGLKFCQVDF